MLPLKHADFPPILVRKFQQLYRWWFSTTVHNYCTEGQKQCWWFLGI